MSKITKNTPWGTAVVASPSMPLERLTKPYKKGIYLGHVRGYKAGNIVSIVVEGTKTPSHFASEFWCTIPDPLLALVEGYRDVAS